MIRKATIQDASNIALLALKLWPDHSLEELIEEFQEILSHEQSAVFLFFVDEQPAGFARCQLRHDYVEGTESSPVGYLEGIFVDKPYRRQGHARALVVACEEWAKTIGCTEFASDCELENIDSLAFHLKMGFVEANRIICFTKRL